MADILAFPTPAPKDGGALERNRARIAELRRRGEAMIVVEEPPRRKRRNFKFGDDLTMRHADPEDTAPAEYVAPAHDGT